MKKYLLLITLMISAVAGVHAQYDQCCNPVCCDQSGFYVGLFAGANWLHLHKKHDVSGEFDTGFAGAVALGYRFNSNFRAEGEFSYRRNNLDHVKYEGYKYHPKMHTESYAFLVNGYYDLDLNRCFNLDTCLTPYVGLGLGYIHAKSHISIHTPDTYFRYSESSNGLAGQAIVGISARVWQNTDLGVEYRYLLARENCHEQSVGLSLKYGF